MDVTELDAGRSVEDVHGVRLMALLQELVRERGLKGAAEELGVDARTLATSIRRGRLSGHTRVALERLLLADSVAAVERLAEQVRAVAHEDKAALHESGMAFNIHALIGGQMERDAHQKLYLLYPEGNWVDTGRLTPYHVIGSVGYGKPLLDRTLRVEDSMRHAFKVACLSFDSTRISAADVDFPIDVVLYRRNSFRIIERRFQKQDLEQLSRWWGERIRHAIEETPRELLDRAYDEIETAPPAPISTVS